MADTVIVEIHADNEESFIDKNVTFTMYKIGESPGGEWLNIEIDFIFILMVNDFIVSWISNEYQPEM